MGVFDWLKSALDEQHQSGCETTHEAENFVDKYSKQVEAAKQAMYEQQKKEREARIASKGDR